MAEFMGLPPLEVCKELHRLQDSAKNGNKLDNMTLNLELLIQYNLGYRADQLALALGVGVHSIYNRLRTARRIGTANPPRGTPGYRSPLNNRTPSLDLADGDKDTLHQLFKEATEMKPSRRHESNEMFEKWWNAQKALARAFSILIREGATRREIAAELGCSTQFITGRMNQYRGYTPDWKVERW